MIGIRGLHMAGWLIALGVTAGVAAHGVACAQNVAGARSSPLPDAIVLSDSTGKVAARPFNETIMLITVDSGGVAAPALIRPIYGADGRTASGLATWQSDGSVLFTSSDCTTGAYVYSLPQACVRATTQVQTPVGVMLYVGAIGSTTTVAVRSILYDTECSPVMVQQNGLMPVLVTVNLGTVYPLPLSFQ